MSPSLPRAPRRALGTFLLGVLLLTAKAYAHEHDEDQIPEGMAVSPEPLDSILWIHILVQTFAWGILLPTGLVLGIVRSRWHVPTQALGSLLAIAGHFLGHAHKGRQFTHNVHASFAPWLEFVLVGQVALGVYLRLHIKRGFLAHIRRWLVVLHGVIGKTLPVAAWVQMLFGAITALGFCRADHLGQCLAHFIMGSAFIGYGIILTILLLVGQAWLRRTGKSQEFFDSILIAAWGCVNTFTEHRWGDPWAHNDLQHTTMGIVWWCAGLLGIWLSRGRDGRPKRNLIPAIVITLTGYAMSAHPQTLMISTMIHTFFGYTLMLAGITRIIEISIVLKDRQTASMDGSDVRSWQHLPPFLLYASGLLFMGAQEEQMALLATAGVTHVSYILILYSVAFLFYLFVNILLHIYAVNTMPAPSTSRSGHQRLASSASGRRPRRRAGQQEDLEDYVDADAIPYADGDDIELQEQGKPNGTANGAIKLGVAMTEQERRRMRDAQDFELDALISDDEDGEDKSRVKSGEDGEANIRL